jgi:hypothetical protein
MVLQSHSTAMGAPVSLYSAQKGINPGLNDILSFYGSSAISTTQCVPVMVKTPISRHRGSVILVDDSTYATEVIADDGMCSYTEPFWLNPEEGNMVMKMCAHGDVGKLTRDDRIGRDTGLRLLVSYFNGRYS